MRDTHTVSHECTSEEQSLLLGGRSQIDTTPECTNSDDSPAVDFEGLPWWKTPSICWILPPFLLYALAFGGIIIPKLNLTLSLICRDYTKQPVLLGSENPQCRIPEVQSRVAQFTLYCNLVGGLLSAIVSPKLGVLSDCYGRTRALAFTMIGTLLAEMITILAATFIDTFPVNWLLVGYALEGLCGTFIAAMAITHSYAADCTPPRKRAVAFGYFHGYLFTGIAIGPILAGIIIDRFGSVILTFYVGLACNFVFIIFIILFIPESLSMRRQLVAREKYRLERVKAGLGGCRINRILSYNPFQPLKILYPTGEVSSSHVRRNLVLLTVVDTVLFGVSMGSVTVVIIYTNFQFGWGNLESSFFVSIVNTCRVFCLFIILPITMRLIRGPKDSNRTDNATFDIFDLSIIRLAILFHILGFIGYTLFRTGSLFILSGIITSVGGIGSPALQSALVIHAPPDQTGQVLGASGLLHALARVVAPTIFSAIYSETVGKFSQTVFVCLAVTFGITLLVTFLIRPYAQKLSEGP